MVKLEDIKSAEPVEDRDLVMKRFRDRGSIPAGFDHPVKAARSILPKSGMTLERAKERCKKLEVPWDDAYKDRVVPYLASDDIADSDGDIVLQNWKLDSFEKNPAMPFSHNWEGLSLGVHLDWGVKELEPVAGGRKAPTNQLTVESLFATEETYKFADTVFRLVKAGMFRAGSVGFMPGDVFEVKDKDEREHWGVGKDSFVVSGSELLEFSPTLLGANQRAGVLQMQEAKQRGLLKACDIPVMRELLRGNVFLPNDDWVEEDARLIALAKTLFSRDSAIISLMRAKDRDEKLAEMAEGDGPIVKGASTVDLATINAKLDSLGELLDGHIQATNDRLDRMSSVQLPDEDPYERLAREILVN